MLLTTYLKSWLLSLSLLLGFGLHAQADEVIIEGQVTALGQPVEYYEVFVFSEIGIFNLALTDTEGFYATELAIPAGTTAQVTVAVLDVCTGIEQVESFQATSGDIAEVNFTLCSGCQAAYFYNLPDPDELTVHFSGYSAGNIDSWAWDFGDGSNSTEQDPSHTYTEEGIYQVSLTVTSGDTCESTITQTVFVLFNQGNPDCEALFFPEYPNPDNTLEVAFLDLSYPIGEIITWNWDFGDGNTSTEQNPTHFYAAPGIYFVSLVITTADGCTSNFSFPVEAGFDYSGGGDCQALFTYEADPTDSLTIHFTDTSSGEVVEWYWEFGDGTTSAEQNPSHTYAQAGTYIVALTITTIEGCYNYYCIFVQVGEDGGVFEDCTAAFFFYPDFQDPLTLFFQDLSFSTTSPITSWSWDFGDGSSSNEPFPVHTYADSGIYTVTLIIETVDGCSDTSSLDLAIFDIGDPTNPCGCPTIIDEVCITLSDGQILVFDNACIAACYGYFDYENCDNGGGGGCQANFWYFANELGTDSLSVQFIDQSGGDIISWAWDFGDGNTSNEANPIHTYVEPGIYVCSLTITTSDGCTSTAGGTILVEGPPNPFECAALFWFDYNPADPYTFNFQDLSAGNPTSWFWDFGDGNTSTEQNPTHTYLQAGFYNVELEITNAEGCVSTYLMIVLVDDDIFYNGNCQALFLPVFNGLEITFINLSIGEVVSAEWDFGDGGTSTELSPTYTYAEPGSYDVLLTTTTAEGCQSSFSITLNLDEANFHGNSAAAAMAVTSSEEVNTTTELKIFPNPVQTSLQVRFTSLDNGNTTLRLFDANGKLVQVQDLQRVSGLNQAALSVHALPTGYYLLQLQHDSSVQTVRFIKE